MCTAQLPASRLMPSQLSDYSAPQVAPTESSNSHMPCNTQPGSTANAVNGIFFKKNIRCWICLPVCASYLDISYTLRPVQTQHLIEPSSDAVASFASLHVTPQGPHASVGSSSPHKITEFSGGQPRDTSRRLSGTAPCPSRSARTTSPPAGARS